jgi:type I restriction enzyme, S subunit
LLLQRVARFQLSRDIHPDYLYAFLRSPFFIDAITEHDQSIGVPHVSPKQVESVEMPLPDLKTQEQVAVRVQDKIAAANKLCSTLETQLAEINRLPSALLREAFTGELK